MEVRETRCDICGRKIENGCTIRSNNRGIRKGWPTNMAFRFDLCKECYDAIVAACKAKRESEKEGIKQ